MNECRWCGLTHIKGICPKVKAIEFFENGEVKRVEFLTPRDIAMPTAWPFASQPSVTGQRPVATWTTLVAGPGVSYGLPQNSPTGRPLQ